MATLSELSVGSIVKLNVDSVSNNWLVVQQGIPSSKYDSSCDGTWLMMESLYGSVKWNNSFSALNDYSTSNVDQYLNSDFLNLFDSDVKNAVKTVKIPYRSGGGSSGSVVTGASGLSTQVFLPSAQEMSSSTLTSVISEGATLAYFKGKGDTDRIAYKNGVASRYLIRTPDKSNDYYITLVSNKGRVGSGYSCADPYPVRPIIILPYTFEIGSSFCGNQNFGGTWEEMDSVWECYNGVWTEIAEGYECINGVWQETN